VTATIHPAAILKVTQTRGLRAELGSTLIGIVPSLVTLRNRDLVRYHGKMMIIDEKVLHVYGFNFTRLDIAKSRSLGVITKNRKLVQEAVKLFRADDTRQPYMPGSDRFVISPENARERLARFISGARKLVDRDVDAYLCLVGDGPNRDRLERFPDKPRRVMEGGLDGDLRIVERVRVHGYLRTARAASEQIDGATAAHHLQRPLPRLRRAHGLNHGVGAASAFGQLPDSFRRIA